MALNIFMLLLLGILPLLLASEETQPVAVGRRLKSRAKGAKNKKSKGNKSGKQGNIFNVDHKDACTSIRKKKYCKKRPECQWSKSRGCFKPISLPTQEPSRGPAPEPVSSKPTVCVNPEPILSSQGDCQGLCCPGYKCVNEFNPLNLSDPFQLCQELQPTQSPTSGPTECVNPSRVPFGICPSDGSEWCCPGSYCKGLSGTMEGVWCESCDSCSIERKDIFDKNKCPLGCWKEVGVDFLSGYCGCKCTNPEACEDPHYTMNPSKLCCPGYECKSHECVEVYTYGKDVCWKVDNNDDDFQSCFVRPDDDCVGDLGYGCRPAIGNWITMKFVQNPGYVHGPRVCGPKCQEVVPIGADNFAWLFNLPESGRGMNDMLCYENYKTGERCYVDYMAECQPDPDGDKPVHGLGIGNLCHPLPAEEWSELNSEYPPNCGLATAVKKCSNLGWSQPKTFDGFQCWSDQKGNYCEFL